MDDPNVFLFRPDTLRCKRRNNNELITDETNMDNVRKLAYFVNLTYDLVSKLTTRKKTNQPL